MARKPSVSGGRPIVVACKVSEAEAAVIDAARGSLTRSQWLRMMLVDYKKTLPKAP